MSNKQLTTIHPRQAGFTLVEVVVAMSIFAIGILATTQAADFGFRASATNERTVSALNLAREGVEGVRNIRDSNWAVLARGAGGNGFSWDCLPGPNRGVDSPPGCDWKLTDAGSSNFILYPQMGNGLWSLQKNTAATAGSTQDPAYQLCLFTGTITAGADGAKPAPFYTPQNLNAPCATEQSFYRRTVVSRGKDLGGNQYSAKVTVYVSWPGKKGSDLVLEEYLTDWRDQ